MYYAQINKSDGLGNKSYEYIDGVTLHTLANGDLELSIKKHDIFNGTKYDKFLVTPKRIEFCDVGILIENHDGSFSVIVSDNPNGTIASIVKRDSEAAKQKGQVKEVKEVKEVQFIIEIFAEIIEKFLMSPLSMDVGIIYPHTIAHYFNNQLAYLPLIVSDVEIFAVPSITPICNLKSANFLLKVSNSNFEPSKILKDFMEKSFPKTKYYFVEDDIQKEDDCDEN